MAVETELKLLLPPDTAAGILRRPALRNLLAPAAETPAASPQDQLKSDVLSALQNLGYHRPLAEKAVEAAVDAAPDVTAASFERVFKSALKALMRP